MKTCSRCNVSKDFSEFGPRKNSVDGYRGQCRVCQRTYAIEKYGRTKVTAEYQRDWKKKHPERMAVYAKRRDGSLSKKSACRRILGMALKSGIMVRPSVCSACGNKGPVEAHHVDYDQPLKISWLCRPCHCTTWRKIP